MFSKALFKQSCKANGLMWGIITFAVCFMLACVMLISGSGNVSTMKNAVENTIIIENIDSELEKRAINYFTLSLDGTKEFDRLFLKGFKESFIQEYYIASNYQSKTDIWLNELPDKTDFERVEDYMLALQNWQTNIPSTDNNNAANCYLYYLNIWLESMPKESDYETSDNYNEALSYWNTQKPTAIAAAFVAVTQYDVVDIYSQAISNLENYIGELASAIDPSYIKGTDGYDEIYADIMFSINPNGVMNATYESFESGSAIESYDVSNLVLAIKPEDMISWLESSNSDDFSNYINDEERENYRLERSKYSSSIFLAGNMTTLTSQEKMIEALAEYGVTKEVYDSFGYTYNSIKHTATTAILSYQARYEYELTLIDSTNPLLIAKLKDSLKADICNSLLDSLPKDVSDGIQEIGQMDLYSLIVGSVFYKIAGLLLPIIFMIMAANNLIVGQVDSGSMAYILSTSTKRKQVVFTQACYLVGSLFIMFLCTTITSFICLSIVDLKSSNLTYTKLLLINTGAFLVLFAMSGINFLSSCWFDRSKRSMALGGGLSMFFLVATMLGLFGSKVIPTVVRLETLNNFNYVSIISFFDAISIIDGTKVFIWKFAVLLGIGIAGYIIGSKKFERKDLPL
ncbi:MAG: ABC transporter permease subunit [Bacilli bacterium]|nr:ABC transporter permease subunit [Bacilli bacterium]